MSEESVPHQGTPPREAEPSDRPKQSPGVSSSDWRQALSALVVVMELTACVVVTALGGFYLDRWLKTSPVFFLLLVGLGCVAAFLLLLRLARRYQQGSS